MSPSNDKNKLTVGEKVSDAIARGGKSWAFILSLNGVIAAWMILNSMSVFPHWDVYPFIALNLFLSWLAANQAPVIMMSQGRQEDAQRVTQQHTLDNTAAIRETVNALAPMPKAFQVLMQAHTKLENSISEMHKDILELKKNQSQTGAIENSGKDAAPN